MTRTIDLHAHVIVPEILRDAAPSEEWRPRLWRDDDGTRVVEMGGRQVRAGVREWTDPEQVLADQDAAGTDMVVLSPVVMLLGHDADPDEGLRRARIQNEGLARLVSEHSDRIGTLGTVPMQNPALAAEELRRIMADGVLAGVELAASVGGTYLGDPSFEPFWAAAEETGALVFIHPTTRGFPAPVFQEHYLWNAVGNPLETTVTAAHLIMTGTMERHPGLRVMLAHGGGAILSLRGRLQHVHTFQPAARSKLTESPEDSLRRFYFDTVVHDPGLLKILVDTVGADRVVLGSDHPFDMGDLTPAATVRAAGLEASDEEAVLGGNAAALLGLEVRS
jgi:aminocarboxymuconate-semialdehyde decarboxylase